MNRPKGKNSLELQLDLNNGFNNYNYGEYSQNDQSMRPNQYYDDEEEKQSLINIPIYANAGGNIDKLSLMSDTDDEFENEE